jgi:hypothetical protein
MAARRPTANHSPGSALTTISVTDNKNIKKKKKKNSRLGCSVEKKKFIFQDQ